MKSVTTIPPDLFEPYKVWAKTEAMPYLGGQMDVVGFWITTADPPEILGAPTDHLGTANVTWIIRWRDMAHRNEAWATVLESLEWKTFSRVFRKGCPAICASRPNSRNR